MHVPRPGNAGQNTFRGRRSFRLAFSLRSMFIVMTFFGLWLAWQRHIVEERKAILAQIETVFDEQQAEIAEINPTDRSQSPYYPFVLGYEDGSFTNDTQLGNIEYTRLSYVRRLFGDDPYLVLNLPPGLAPQWIERVEHVFPEARLFIHNRDGDRPLEYEFRDALCRPIELREPNVGTVFKTGLKQ